MAKKQIVRMVGGCSAARDTATAASAAADLLAHACASSLRQGPALYHVHGLTVVIYPELRGTSGDDTLQWNYDILDPKALRDDPASDQARGMSGTLSRDDAMARAINHAAQWAWSPAVDDDSTFVARLPVCLPESLRAELRSWIAWQRRCVAIIATFKESGYHAECGYALNTVTHRLACESRTIDEAITMTRAHIATGHLPAR